MYNLVRVSVCVSELLHGGHSLLADSDYIFLEAQSLTKQDEQYIIGGS